MLNNHHLLSENEDFENIVAEEDIGFNFKFITPTIPPCGNNGNNNGAFVSSCSYNDQPVPTVHYPSLNLPLNANALGQQQHKQQQQQQQQQEKEQQQHHHQQQQQQQQQQNLVIPGAGSSCAYGANITTSVSNNIDQVQFPEVEQIDFEFLQKMQESQWEKFYQETYNPIKQEDFALQSNNGVLPQSYVNGNIFQQSTQATIKQEDENGGGNRCNEEEENGEDMDSPASSEDDREVFDDQGKPFDSPKPFCHRSTSNKIKKLLINKKSKRRRRRRSNLLKPGSQLYQFILQLLDDESKRELICWEKPHSSGIFRIVNKEKVAKLWGENRNREMSYDSLSRGLRHYYSQGLLNAVNKKLHYQFTQKALDEWEIIRDKESIEDR